MREKHHRGFGRPPDGPDEDRYDHGRHHHGRHRGRRMFDYGDLRLLLLAMIADSPRHGYELIKAIEDRLGGAYSPSPGVIYPTLAWLDDMGYAAIDAEEGGRKRYRITGEGQSFLAANRPAVDALLARIGSGEGDGPPPIPAPVIRAMENLKFALRLRLRQGPIDDKGAEAIATALDEATRAVEKAR